MYAVNILQRVRSHIIKPCIRFSHIILETLIEAHDILLFIIARNLNETINHIRRFFDHKINGTALHLNTPSYQRRSVYSKSKCSTEGLLSTFRNDYFKLEITKAEK